VKGLESVGRHFTLIRSKDAGPFMLTIDFFFVDGDSRRAFMDAEVFSAARIAALYGVDPVIVSTYDLPDINALKISFPRPVISGDFGDTDITGGQQYPLVIDMIAALEIDGAGADLVVHV